MERNTYSVTLFIGSVSSHGCLDVPEVLYDGYIEPTVFTAVFVVHGLSLDTQKNTTIYNP